MVAGVGVVAGDVLGVVSRVDAGVAGGLVLAVTVAGANVVVVFVVAVARVVAVLARVIDGATVLGVTVVGVVVATTVEGTVVTVVAPRLWLRDSTVAAITSASMIARPATRAEIRRRRAASHGATTARRRRLSPGDAENGHGGTPTHPADRGRRGRRAG